MITAVFGSGSIQAVVSPNTARSGNGAGAMPAACWPAVGGEGGKRWPCSFEAPELQDEVGKARDVFLYSRSLMVAGSQALVLESLPSIRVDGTL